jgi:amino acid adenylation domain-containing protein
MTDLNERLAGLSPEKRALLAKRLQEKGRAENAFPLSIMQQRLWFLEQLSPGNLAYVIPAAVRIRGNLDVEVLRAVVNEIVRRHESLRTTFELREGKPAQIVKAPAPLEVAVEDLRHLAGQARAAACEKRIAEELALPFDLARGPLLRARLLRTEDQEHVLVVAMHHIVSDGWSLGILVTELARLYEAFVAGRPSPLPPLKVQYGDYAAWQQGWLRKENLAEHLAYWRKRLAGAVTVLGLPTDRPRPPVQTFDGGSQPFEIPAAWMRALGAVAQERGATPFMALLAVFQILLHRYGNQDDVVIGVPVANRNRAEVEGLIGFFVNTLAVRTDLAGNPSFGALLERVRDACAGDYGHQELPFEKLVEDLRPARDLSRPPIFQVSFSYQAAPLPSFDVAGLRLDRLPLKSTTARFDLELQFFNERGGLTGWFEYNRDLFDESTMARLAGHFGRLVELVIADPARPIDELPLLADAERQELVVAGNATARDWPGEGFIHQCFERCARETPKAEALRFEGQSLSYRELDRRANQLAQRLRRLGVGRDVLVGVCMERSVEMVVSLLAILKAGGAYVPLDPGYPLARLEFMLEDSRVPVLLTQRRVMEKLPPVAAEVLCVEELGAELDRESAESPCVEVGGEDLAYVIYTSGSTGKPKGAMNLHAAIRNRLLWMQDAYGLGSTDRVLQKTPFSFDVSVWEFFWPLMTGACLVVARPEGHKDGRYLIDTIRAERITTLHFVPSMLGVFLQEPEVEECGSLRRVICSGEALPRELQERFFSRSQAELHNLYGPTEAAVDVTFWACRRDADPRPVPIGHPIANTQMYVLDRYLQPVPVGVAGELFIGGRNLARGYLNRPELTAERFIPHPFDGASGARVYRTGDLARYREDGAIEYLGRLDHQVKLRGFRIELGEIEEVLASHPRLRAAVVIARELAKGDTRLIAYVAGDEEPKAGELIAFLKERLPEYMVPSAFIFLPALPLSPNGKVDRAALPVPELSRPELQTPFVPPAEGVERSIAEVWSRLLGIERVGVHDNFFDLGGHSLLMAELKNSLQTKLGRTVSMVELFQYPTVKALTEHLEEPAGAEARPLVEARERVESRQSLAQRRQVAAARRSRARSDG